MRRAARTDGNHREIADIARALGCSVLDLSRVGNGCPDLLIGAYMGHRVNWLVEVKDSTKPPSKRVLTPDQKVFHETWRGQVCVVTCVDDLLALIKQKEI